MDQKTIRNLAQALFLVFIVVDILVIVSLLKTLFVGARLEVNIAMTLFFVYAIDIAPIFTLTPLLKKHFDGLTRKTKGENFLFIASIAVFLLAWLLYFFLSIGHPERLRAEALLKLVGEEKIGNTLILLSAVVGFVPIVTTTLSMVINYYVIGTKYIEEHIEKLEADVKELEKKNTQLERNGILLQNLSISSASIGKHASSCADKIEEFKQESMEQEKKRMEAANAAAKEECIKGLNDFILQCEKRFEAADLLSDPDGKARYEDWRRFVGTTKAKMEQGLA